MAQLVLAHPNYYFDVDDDDTKDNYNLTGSSRWW